MYIKTIFSPVLHIMRILCTYCIFIEISVLNVKDFLKFCNIVIMLKFNIIKL